MFLLIEIIYLILILWYGNYIEVERIQLYAWNWQFKELPQKYLGVLKGDFWRFGYAKDAQTPCWLMLCLELLTNKYYVLSGDIHMVLIICEWPFKSNGLAECRVFKEKIMDLVWNPFWSSWYIETDVNRNLSIVFDESSAIIDFNLMCFVSLQRSLTHVTMPACSTRQRWAWMPMLKSGCLFSLRR